MTSTGTAIDSFTGKSKIKPTDRLFGILEENLLGDYTTESVFLDVYSGSIGLAEFL